MTYCIHCMEPMMDGMPVCRRCGKPQTVTCPEHHLRPGTLLNRRYVVGTALGEGGFGITYIARDTRLDVVVAVKEFYPDGYANRNNMYTHNVTAATKGLTFFEKGKAKFLAEARLLAGLRDENGIVDVQDFFEENNTAYIVMEYLRGETLAALLKRVGVLPQQEADRLLRPVMHSLAVAHERGVVHRDIAPDNIMLTRDGAKLLDFGAAREVFSEDERSLSIMVKRGFSPYEQYSRTNQGPWTDVYALCATMYRALTGAAPPDALQRVQDPNRPLPFPPTVSRNLQAVLTRGLAVYPEQRYRSIAELLQAMDAPAPPQPVWQGNDIPVVAPPAPPVPSAPEKKSAAKWIVTAVVAVLILAGVGFGVWRIQHDKPVIDGETTTTTAPETTPTETDTEAPTGPTEPPVQMEAFTLTGGITVKCAEGLAEMSGEVLLAKDRAWLIETETAADATAYAGGNTTAENLVKEHGFTQTRKTLGTYTYDVASGMLEGKYVYLYLTRLGSSAPYYGIGFEVNGLDQSAISAAESVLATMEVDFGYQPPITESATEAPTVEIPVTNMHAEKTVNLNTAAGSGDILNVRRSRSGDADIVFTVPNGATVTVLAQKDDWSFIEYNGQQGWCMTSVARFDVAEPTHYRVETCRDIFLSKTFLLEYELDGESTEIATKNGDSYVRVKAEDDDFIMIKQAATGKTYILIPDMKIYSEVTDEEDTVDVDAIIAEFTDCFSGSEITASTGTVNGKTLYCEDVTARDGSTTRFYFDGDDLCYIDVDNGQMKINKLTGTVPDSLFEIPSGYTYFDSVH